MTVVLKELSLSVGESFELVPVFDAHVGSAEAQEDLLVRHVNKCAKLENPMFFWGGDVLNCIYPGDTRYQEGLRRRYPQEFMDRIEKRGVTESQYLQVDVEWLFEKFGHLSWLFAATGNHEYEFLKRHGVDPTSVLCSRFGMAHGSYDGWLVIRAESKGKTNASSVSKIRYSHGSWGGVYARGELGAFRYGSVFEDWDLLLYGHYHGAKAVSHSKISLTPRMRERRGTKWMINCGSLKMPGNKQDPGWARVKGFMPTPLTLYSIRGTYVRTRVNGVDERRIEYTPIPHSYEVEL